MVESTNCPSCGAANRLPDGKLSMFCAYCGNSIVINNGIEKPKISKAEIINGSLAYNDRGLTSLYEVIELYSDTELEKIECLDLSDNNIKDVKGLSKFPNVRDLNLSKNQISEITELPSFGLNTTELIDLSFNKTVFPFRIEINLSFNSISEISDNTASAFNSIYVSENIMANYLIILTVNPNFNNETLSKIDFQKFSNECTIIVGKDNSSFSEELKAKGFSNSDGVFKYVKNQKSVGTNITKELTPNFFQNIFGRLSIIDWIALVVPYILAIVMFKYNKDDKTSTIGFLDFLVVFLVIAVIIRFYPFFSRRVKTGRSFESQYGNVEEYTTVEGKINTEHGWWIVSLINIAVIVFILKVHGFGTSNVQQSPTEYNASNSTATEPPHDNSETPPQEQTSSSNKIEVTNQQESEEANKTQNLEVQEAKPEISSGIVKAIVQKAYFYDEPNRQTKRSSYIVEGQSVEYTETQNGFIKTSFTNGRGVKTEGWMLKSDFDEVNQTTSSNNINFNNNDIYTVVEQMPSFVGGQSEYNKFIAANLKYPEEARLASMQGTSVVQFVVEKDGSLSNVHIIKGVGHGDWGKSLDNEALRLVGLMPSWDAGKQGGNAVRVNYNLPISFKLQ